MDQLDYFSDIDEVIETMKEIKEDSMYLPQIRNSFGFDNETIFSYKAFKNNVLIYRAQPWWHNRHYYDGINSFIKGSPEYYMAKSKYEARCIKDMAVITHFISKNFGLIFNYD